MFLFNWWVGGCSFLVCSWVVGGCSWVVCVLGVLGRWVFLDGGVGGWVGVLGWWGGKVGVVGWWGEGGVEVEVEGLSA